MTIQEAIVHRHSIRKYKDEPLSEEHRNKLLEEISQCNTESGLHIQLITGQGDAFEGLLAHYGGFRNVHSYIALVGKNTPELDELCGYYGERIVLYAETLGLGTCWVGGTYRKNKARYVLEDGEKLCLVISVGYPAEEGHIHRNKKKEEISNITENSPAWFVQGVEYALLAPTAVNQQKFFLSYQEPVQVSISTKSGPFSKVDLGIVKYHFEIGAGSHFTWKE